MFQPVRKKEKQYVRQMICISTRWDRGVSIYLQTLPLIIGLTDEPVVQFDVLAIKTYICRCLQINDKNDK